MMETVAQLPHLSVRERLALAELLNRLGREYSQTILQVVLYGSCVRGGRGSDSDVDLLIVTRNDNWQEQEPIRFLVARLSNEYDVFLSVWLISLTRLQWLRSRQSLLYQSICRDGLELLRLSHRPELVEGQSISASLIKGQPKESRPNDDTEI